MGGMPWEAAEPDQEHGLLSLPGYLPGVKGLLVEGGEAFVSSKNLQVRGCEVWTEEGGAGRASGKKHNLLQISELPHSNAQLLPGYAQDQPHAARRSLGGFALHAELLPPH